MKIETPVKSTFPTEGVIVALWLPITESGKLDREALRAHFSWLRECGIHGVMALGSSGRFPLMDLKWRLDALGFIAELAEDLPVIANISDIRPSVVAELGREAKTLDLAGIAIMPPSFYRVKDADQLAFFEHTAEQVDLPVLLYNFPELTGNRISPETIATFADRQRMAGIKQSGGEFEYHRELVDLGKSKGFSVFSGADTRLHEVLPMGASGCIGGLVNLVPEYMVAQFNHFCRGLPTELDLTCSRMAEVGRIVNQLPLPLSVASGVRARGWTDGANVSVVSRQSSAMMEGIVADLKAAFRSWGLPFGPHASSSFASA